MKSVVLPSLLFGVGLAVGWLVKPEAEPQKATTAEPAAPRVVVPAPEIEKPAELDPPVPEIPVPLPGPAPIVQTEMGALAEANAKRRDEAKLERLVEALNLSAEQKASLLDLIEKSRVAPGPNEDGRFPGPGETLANLKAMGAALDASLKTLLTPEQQTAFAELRNRVEENRTASRTGRELAEIQDIVDLTEEQREELRKRLLAETRAGGPAAELALVLDSSPLPLGQGSMNNQAVESLQSMMNAPTSADPRVAHLELIQYQRRELDQKVERLKGILTPAQLQRFEAEQADQRMILDQMAPPSP